MQNMRLLTMQKAQETLYIADDDMIHLTWRHVTLRLNVTGLIYLVDYLTGVNHRRIAGFDVCGTQDDGFQIWIQDVGLRLAWEDYQRFKQLLVDGLAALRSTDLPTELQFTADARVSASFSMN